nr:glycosyltransferase [Candidatus Chloroploca mongolica]
MLFSTYDRAGGAEKVAFDLCRSYCQRGHDARLLVRYKRTQEPFVFEVDPYRDTTPWAGMCRHLEKSVRRQSAFRGQYRLIDMLRRLALPQRLWDRWRGTEDFNYPFTWHLLDADNDWQPDVIHAHNLHGDYFDLGALSMLSQRLPVVWTLHDTWAITGHCGYFIDCERWRTGCGACPDLGRPPAIQRDRTAANWQQKQTIYRNSRLAISTPSRWLMNYVEQSMLLPWQARVIPNGVDLSIYHPGDRAQARAECGIAADAFVVVFSAFSGANTNPYKDFTTVRTAVQLLRGSDVSSRLQLICIGGQTQNTDDPGVVYTGYLTDPNAVARYYRCADVLLHAANAENFPLVVLEAMACGATVVATSVGGIPEQIIEGETGFLIARGDSVMLAKHVHWLMAHPDRCKHMGTMAAVYAEHSFSLKAQAESFVNWFASFMYSNC